jgi:uncharacterized protein
MSNVEAVQELYTAFGRGDVPAVLERLADDVEWESWEVGNTAQQAGVPWLKLQRGRDAVAEFFATVGAFEMRDFQVRSILDGGDRVAVEVLIDAVTPSGERLHDEEMHLYGFDDSGQINRMRHYVDTAKHMKAAQVAAASA